MVEMAVSSHPYVQVHGGSIYGFVLATEAGARRARVSTHEQGDALQQVRWPLRYCPGTCGGRLWIVLVGANISS